jgi:hypothetical protein
MSSVASPTHRLVAVASPARPPAHREQLAGQSLKPRLAVLAPSTADVLRFAGGWLTDQALAGWEVSVLTADRCDPRLLRILGARGLDLEAALASSAPLDQSAQSFAVQADLYDSDVRIRRMLGRARQARSADVLLWGGVQPAALGYAALVRHRVSLAARAFRAQAVAALHIPAEAVTEVEVFRSLGPAVPAGR